MSDITFTCDAEHAVHFDRDYHCVIGHLQSFKVGADVALATDLNMLEPKTQEAVTVAGLLTSISWGGAPEDSVTIKALLSSNNRQKILNVMHKAVSDAKCKVSFVVYDYDPEDKKWFRTFNTAGQEIDGMLAQGDANTRGKLNLSVLATPAQSGGVDLSPLLFEMTATVYPGNTVQEIHFLTSSLRKIVKVWGVATT